MHKVTNYFAQLTSFLRRISWNVMQGKKIKTKFNSATQQGSKLFSNDTSTVFIDFKTPIARIVDLTACALLI